jgi:adenylate cyclase class 2
MEFQEQEIKFYIEDLDGLIARAQATGADLIRPRILERNLRLDTPEGDFRRASRVLRIRQDDGVRVTYKDNAHSENGMVVRTEIEFSTDSLEVTRKFFEALGYQVTVIYEKYRQVYQIGDVQVMFDELPFGSFVEIEAPNAVLIEGVAQMLGLDWSKSINTSYLGLFANARTHCAFSFRDLTFLNFEGVKITAADLEVQPADR